jgi:6-phosphofructokinase 1
MNAAIRAVVRTAASAGIEVIGAQRGFEGLVYGNFRELGGRAVANIIQRGGTVLETSRSGEFRTPAGRTRAAENLRYRGAEALIVIGGDGTLQGSAAFADESGMNVMFVPASIDNDVPGTDYSIGFDTAVNTALEAIDRIRDTAFAYERLFFVEVMGRDSGFIALAVALGGGAEAVIVPEFEFNIDDLCRRIDESAQRGKRSSIIVVSEGPRTGGAIAIADAVKQRLGYEPRVVVLGHIQRGGAPTARDRLLATRLGAAAVEGVAAGREPSLIGEERGEVVYVPLAEASDRQRGLDPRLFDLVRILAI